MLPAVSLPFTCCTARLRQAADEPTSAHCKVLKGRQYLTALTLSVLYRRVHMNPVQVLLLPQQNLLTAVKIAH